MSEQFKVWMNEPEAFTALAARHKVRDDERATALQWFLLGQEARPAPIEVTQADAAMLTDLIDNPPPRNAAFQAAQERYQARIASDDNEEWRAVPRVAEGTTPNKRLIGEG